MSILNRRDALKISGVGALLAAASPALARSAKAKAPKAAPAALAFFPGAYVEGQYALPPLPYAPEALEPVYDAATVKIHHGKHHAGYVNGLNQAVAKLKAARAAGNFDAIKGLSRALAFAGSGHALHTLFWHSMTPGGAKPSEGFKAAMAESFGSLEAGLAQLAAASNKVEGSGWGILAYEPLSRGLIVLQAEKHQNLAFMGAVPLLACDVWEHAYYLKYQNDRGAWVDGFMKLADLDFASRLYDAVKLG
ncbi:superoxide dismutase [Myxococcota bacterium]|nr:superoxide dismutase [Myxococcota bacterium]MBU1431363.1 superoxide dismutase [Myxococcota bacterium]MBU1898391.1 superoxide dismutase [Myxococcota bacterium]